MPISDEKLEELLDVLKTMMIDIKNVQHENSQLNRQVLELTRASLESPNNPQQPDEIVAASNQGLTRTSRAKPNRPTIQTDMDDINWTIFIDSWNRYKKLANINNTEDVYLELREACSTDINKLLYEFVGAAELNSEDLTEAKLLEHIRLVVVKTVHKEVHRWKFGGIVQRNGEPVSRFIGRLKSQASLCSFMVICQCGHDVSYAEEMVSQRMVFGLANPEHQARIVSEAQDLDNLTKKVERIVSLDTTDEAADKIRTPSSVSAGAVKFSQYRRSQRAQFKRDKSPKSQSPKERGDRVKSQWLQNQQSP